MSTYITHVIVLVLMLIACLRRKELGFIFMALGSAFGILFSTNNVLAALAGEPTFRHGIWDEISSMFNYVPMVLGIIGWGLLAFGRTKTVAAQK